MQYNFEWDPPRKAKANITKHGISFEQGTKVFLDELHIAVFDDEDEHSETEERWVMIGKTKTGRLLVVIHTFAEYEDHTATVRLISVREAQHEQRQYEEN